MSEPIRKRLATNVLENLETRQLMTASVSSWTLVNSDTNQALATISEQLTIDLAKLPTRNLSIVPNITGSTPVGSAIFLLNGATLPTDNAAPYGLTDGLSSTWKPTLGKQSVGVLLYSGANGTGTYLTKAYRNFFINDSAPATTPPSVTGFSLVNGDTGAVIRPLADGDTLDLNTLPTRNLNVVATVAGTVSSVVYGYDANAVYTTDNSAPYNLSQSGGFTPTLGSHTVSATATTEANGAGTKSAPTVVSFNVIDTNLSPRPVITATTSPSVMVGAAVHLQALSSVVNSGSAITTKYEWNFGDPNGRYNILEGFNAAHVYDTPGTYTVTLTVTDDQGRSATTTQQVSVASDTRRKVYVSTDGDDRNNGTSESSPVRTIARANQLVTGDNVAVYFRRGDTFDTAVNLYLPGKNVLAGAYGDPNAAQPVLRRASASAYELVKTGVNTIGATFQDLTFDSTTPGDLNKSGAARALTPVGRNITLRNCTIANVSDAVTADQNPVGLLIQDNKTTSDTSIRGYLLWAQGSDIVLVGNTASNSTREHILRVGGATRLLAAYNDFANVDRRSLGDSQDIAKGTATLQKGSYWTITRNILTGGGLGVGPLGGVDGLSDVNARAQWVVVSYNQVNGISIGVNPGSEHVSFNNNVIQRDDNEVIVVQPTDLTKDTAGRFAYADRNLLDVQIFSNTGINNSKNGRFLSLKAASNPGQITLTNNLYIAPNLETGYNQNAEIYIAASDLSSFAYIDGNVFGTPKVIKWVADAHMYMWPSWADPKGYLSRSQWNAMSQVGTDHFANVTLAEGVFKAVVNGVTAGATL